MHINYMSKFMIRKIDTCGCRLAGLRILQVTKYYDKLLRFTVFIVDISYPIRAFFFHKECTGGAVCGMSYPRIVTWSPTTLKKVTYWALYTIVEAQVEKASFSQGLTSNLVNRRCGH